MLPINISSKYDKDEMSRLIQAGTTPPTSRNRTEIERNVRELMKILDAPNLPIRYAKTRSEFVEAVRNEWMPWLLNPAQSFAPSPEWVATELRWRDNVVTATWFNALIAVLPSGIIDNVNEASWFAVLGVVDPSDVNCAAWSCFRRAFEAGMWLFTATKEAFWIVETPTAYVEDTENNRRPRLHCADKPAFEFLDYKGYFWHGLAVDEYVIMQPEKITIEDIEGTANIELRRAKMERYGTGRYLLDSGAEEVQRDRFGILYLKRVRGDEDIVMVKVVNSTPEPDGSFHEYMIRVPATTKTAHEGIAWTFNLRPDQYHPHFES